MSVLSALVDEATGYQDSFGIDKRCASENSWIGYLALLSFDQVGQDVSRTNSMKQIFKPDAAGHGPDGNEGQPSKRRSGATPIRLSFGIGSEPQVFMDELKRLNPKRLTTGNRRPTKHHQWLHCRMSGTLTFKPTSYGVIALMRASQPNWDGLQAEAFREPSYPKPERTDSARARRRRMIKRYFAIALAAVVLSVAGASARANNLDDAIESIVEEAESDRFQLWNRLPSCDPVGSLVLAKDKDAGENRSEE